MEVYSDKELLEAIRKGKGKKMNKLKVKHTSFILIQ